MKLAVNYSESLLGLLNENPELEVDYIKVPTLPFPGSFVQFDLGRKWRRLLPHIAQPGVLALGYPAGEERFNPEIVAQIIRRARPDYLSTHLEARVEFYSEYRQYQHESHPDLRRAMLERLLTAIAQVKQDTRLPLLLENCPYLRRDRIRLASEPEFISTVCELGDCDFLLDIAHAQCSAWSMGENIEDYIKAMPLERLREIHLAGVQEKEYGIWDTHTVLREGDYQLLEMVLKRARPEIITLEYGGMPEKLINWKGEFEAVSRNDPGELAMMISRLRKIIASSN